MDQFVHSFEFSISLKKIFGSEITINEALQKTWVFIVLKFKNLDFIQWSELTNLKNLHGINHTISTDPDQTFLSWVCTESKVKSGPMTQKKTSPDLGECIFFVNSTLEDLDFKKLKGSFSTPLIVFNLMENQGRCKILYESDNENTAIIQEMAKSFSFLLENFNDLKLTPLKEITIITPEQMKWLQDWNHYLPTKISETIPESICKIIAKQPYALAVISQERCLTYGELDMLSDSVAQQLNKFILNNQNPIAFYGEKSWKLIVLMLSLLKLGIPYLPISTSSPNARIENILKESRSQLLICNPDEKISFLEKQYCSSISLDTLLITSLPTIEPFQLQCTPSSLAYIIYTSGSTGQPKGVVVSQAAALVTLKAMQKSLDLNSSDRVLALSSFSFDLSIFDIFGSLICGSTIVLTSEKDHKNPESWVKLIQTYRVTVWNSVPALMTLLLEYSAGSSPKETLASLRWILLSGDLIPQNMPQNIQNALENNCQILALGGSTEASIWSIECNITRWMPNKVIPYGRPLPHQTTYIIDSNENILPPGAVGEIVIGGDALANEYWQNNDLTQERFSALFSINRIFKTRDRGYINPENFLAQFMGRLDRQTKIQGYRIDLTEIEKLLCQIPCIESAIIIPYTNAHHVKKMFAFLKKSPAVEIASDQDIINYLQKYLSPETIPHQYCWLEEWPLTSNHKIDTKKLACMIENFKAAPLQSKSLNLNQETTSSDDLLPVTPTHAGLLYEGITGKKGIYNVTFVFHYKKVFDHKLLESAWNKTIELYDALRQSFIYTDSLDNIFSKIHKSIITPFYYFDWSTFEKPQTESWLKERVKYYREEYFPLKKLPLFRIEHFHLANDEDRICFYANHLIFDAASSIALIETFNEIYDKLEFGQLNTHDFDLLHKHTAPSYSDFLKWRANLDMQAHLNFWKRELASLEQPSLIAYELEKPFTSSTSQLLQTSISIPFSNINNICVKDFCKNHAISLLTLIQGCWSILLSHWLDQSTVTSGLVLSGKINLPKEYNARVGCFINNLPLIIEIQPTLSFLDFAKEIHTIIHRIKHYDVISMTELNSLSKIRVSDAFDSVVSILNFKSADPEKCPQLSMIEHMQITHYPVTIQIDPHRMEISFLFLNEKISETRQALLVDCFQNLLRQALCNPHKTTKSFTLFEESFSSSNGQAIIFGESISYDFDIVQEFKKASLTSAANIAYIYDGEKISYGDLSNHVQKASSYLKSLPIVNSIGLLLPRGYPFLVMVLACLEANVTFIPINQDKPEKIIKRNLHDANCHHIVVMPDFQKEILNTLARHDFTKIILFENLNKMEKITSQKNEIAYILFTSGSTGYPKGVRTPRSALNNHLASMCSILKMTSQDTWLSVTQNTFDIVFLEILLPLCVGATILFPSDTELNYPHQLNALAIKEQPTLLQTTPSRWRLFAECTDLLSSLRSILVGGEELSKEIFERLSESRKPILNLYGPTETTIWATVSSLNYRDKIHIGKPIHNTWCMIGNRHHDLLPLGVPGEIYIAGAGVTAGYLDPQQTQEAFIALKNEARDCSIIYKTGDYGWIDHNRNLHFLGRKDRQLKIRGHRIDPIEIENAIHSCNLVKQAVVMPMPNDPENLVVFLQAHQKKSRNLSFSIMCFPEKIPTQENAFEFYKSLAITADQLNLHGIWLPERHFDKVGAPFSASVVVAGALSSITKNLVLSAGSIVLPLHHPIEVLEQWATLDCLSNGRSRLSVASGWHPDDFILAPTQYQERKKHLVEKLETLKNAWETGEYEGRNGAGNLSKVSVFPRPLQSKCPLWITIADDKDLFIEAGRLGLHILTHLLFHDIEELSDKISAYRSSLTTHGFISSEYQVAIMLHTYIHPVQGTAKQAIKEPLKKYFKSHLSLVSKINPHSADELEQLADGYFDEIVEKFMNNRCLIGTPHECEPLIKNLYKIGVDEIACLVDFGLTDAVILEGLQAISTLTLNTQSLSRDEKIDLGILKQSLTRLLSTEMIPDHFLWIDEIPLTIHGKIDFQALKTDLQKSTFNPKMIHHQPLPQDNISQKVFELWCSVLRNRVVDFKLSFFESGGNSLRAIELLNKIQKQFDVKISIGHFLSKPYLSNIIDLISSSEITPKHNESKKPALKTENEYFATSPVQTSIWVFSQFFPEAYCYHDVFLFQVKSTTSLDFLLKALDTVFTSDSIFRAAFFEKENKIIQKITSITPHIELKKYSRPALDMPQNDVDFAQDLQSKASLPFNLATPPLARVIVYEFTNRLFFQLTIHHLITDGQSLLNIIKRIECEINHEKYVYPSYLDYITDPKANLKTDPKSIETYIRQMDLVSTQNTLRHVKSRPALKSFQGTQHSILLDRNKIIAIQEVAKTFSSTPSMIILGVYIRTLLAWTDDTTLQIGVPVSLREGMWEKCLGLFINFGVLSFNCRKIAQLPEKELILQIINKMAFLLENRDVFFPSISDALGATLMPNAQLLFQFAYNFFDFNNESEHFLRVPFDYGISRFDIELQAAYSEAQIELTFIFSKDIFCNHHMVHFLKDFNSHLSSFLSNSVSQKNDQNILSYWSSVYNNIYRTSNNLSQQRWIGWNSSIDNEPFSEQVMNEWLQDVLNKLRRQKLGRVLEVGCGTGAIINTIQHECEHYVGIDISDEIIQKLSVIYKSDKIHFKNLVADQIDILSPMKFDTIILNSVVQYFPSTLYFETVIKKAIALLNPAGGRVFLGDLRPTAWQESFYKYLHKNHNNSLFTPDIFSHYLKLEKELWVHPFFYKKLFLGTYFSEVTPLLEPKYMKTINELSLFRCDLTLCFTKNSSVQIKNSPSILDGAMITSNNMLFGLIKNYLAQSSKILIKITNIKSSRLSDFNTNIIPSEVHKIISDLHLSGLLSLEIENPEQMDLYISENFENIFPLLSETIETTEHITVSSTPEVNIKVTEKTKAACPIVEKNLRKIWSYLLEIEENLIKDEANFFSLGGDSLLYVKLFSELSLLGYSFKLTDLLSKRNFSEQLSWLDSL